MNVLPFTQGIPRLRQRRATRGIHSHPLSRFQIYTEAEGNAMGTKDELLLQHELEIMAGILESKAQYRKIVKAGIAKWVKDFQDGRIEIKTVDDLKKLIEIDIELQKDEI